MPEPARAFAPGRVNLIGEHTDYNDGLCLPLAVEQGVTVSAHPIGGPETEVRALDLGEEDRFAPESPVRASGWRGFVRGVTAQLAAAGVAPGPVRLEISSDLPREAGLGSSGALCVALALALSGVAGAPEPDRIELARLCSRVENDWVGARTGLLDQLASLFGAGGHAVRIDMLTVEIAAVPLDLPSHRLATIDSGAPREVGASGYNERRAECAAACAALGLATLREATAEAAEALPEPLGRRVRHVLTENARVDAMVGALHGGAPEEAGRLLDASHTSLRVDYEVSVPPVELAVERAREAGAIGARVMGAGFGGHVLALFPPDAAPPPEARVVSAGDGARLL